jgi:alpha-amylase
VTSVAYNFGGKGFQSSKTFAADSSMADALSIVVQATDSNGETFTQTLESLNFIWQAEKVNVSAAYKDGQKGGIVEMFGWPYADIKAECESLGKMGWMGVKVFPP